MESLIPEMPMPDALEEGGLGRAEAERSERKEKLINFLNSSQLSSPANSGA